MKTPEQIADELVATFEWPRHEIITMSATVLADALIAAIEADRAQLIDLNEARAAIDATYEAAEGDSNDAEIEALQETRDLLEQIVSAFTEAFEDSK